MAALAGTGDIVLTAVSRVYETDPVGGPMQGPYLNAVVAVDTTMSASELLAVAHQIEDEAQRARSIRFGARTLDVDVLLVGDEMVDTPELTVPHPRMWQRGFVLAPLADVAPGLVTRPVDGWPGVEATDAVLRLAGGPSGPDPSARQVDYEDVP